MVATILDRWEQARSQVVYPSTPMPEFTAAVVDKGKKAFLTVGCAQCHGEDGRGQLATNEALNDSWGNPTKAADLTSGMLRGGTEPLDIYRHIDAGINGTPMPSFHAALAERTRDDLEARRRTCSRSPTSRRQGRSSTPGCSKTAS